MGSEPDRGTRAAGVQDQHSTFTWLLEPMLEHAGFGIRDRTTSQSRIYAAYTRFRR